MANTAELPSCAADTLLPTSPFYALHYHFGMLLGVEDFETEQAYHRGKSRLHSAWLHRDGVVWGLGVSIDTDHDEIRVGPGLALDPAGRELHLDEALCVSVPAWLAALPEDERARLAGDDGTQPFDAHVLIRHRACLTRQVPALMELCEGSGQDTAYSRVFETVEVRLLADLPDSPTPPPPGHRVRLMVGLEAARTEAEDGADAAAEDADIMARRDDLLTRPRDERLERALALLRDCAAADTAALAPPASADGEERLLFPGPDDAGVLLGRLSGLTLSAGADGLHLTAGEVSYQDRPALLATRTIQELAAAAFFCCREPPPPEPPSGPRADPDSVTFSDTEVRFQVDASLAPASVTRAAFEVSAFTAGEGWTTYAVETAAYDEPTRTVTLTLTEAPGGDLLRLAALGTGAQSLLGADLVPLAGATGDPPAPTGRDFVHFTNGS